MTATEELRRMLDERGVAWVCYGHENHTWWNGWHAENRPSVNGLFLKVEGVVTPEQAIAATLGGGKLTAEQVRECVQHVYHEGYSDGSVRRGAHIDETDWQAIADELNALVGLDNGVERSSNGVTHYSKLFGTPEHAARTLARFSPLACSYCALHSACGDDQDEDCMLRDYDALLGWLKEDVE